MATTPTIRISPLRHVGQKTQVIWLLLLPWLAGCPHALPPPTIQSIGAQQSKASDRESQRRATVTALDPSSTTQGNAEKATPATVDDDAPSQPSEYGRIQTKGAITVKALAANGVLYFGSHDGSFSAVHSNGNLLWRRQFADRIRCPAIANSSAVIFGSDDDAIHALEIVHGAPKWQFDIPGCRRGKRPGPAESRCDVEGLAQDETGTIFATANGLYGVTEEGQLLWKQVDADTHCGPPTLDSSRRTIYFACQNKTLYAIDSRNGQKRWELALQAEINSLSIFSDGRICGGSDDQKVSCWSPAGVLLWSTLLRGAIRTAPWPQSTGALYVVTDDGNLYDLSPTGQMIWVFQAKERIRSAPVVSDRGLIVFGAQDDRLYGVDSHGVLAWSRLLGGDVDAPATLFDGKIAVGSDDGALYLLQTP